jgi:hypothetical protein
MNVKSLAVAVALLLPAAPASAAENQRQASPDVRTIAVGLDHPRGIAVGPRHEIYVAEPGRITMLAAGHRFRTPVTPRQQAAVTTGPDGRLYAASSPGARTGTATLSRDGRTLAVLPGRAPGALLVTDRGILVVDAVRDELIRISARGRSSTVAALPEPARSVAHGPDGACYLGGRTRIWRIEPGRAPRVYASGFTAVTGLAWTATGRLLVLADGGLIGVDRKGRRHVVVSDGLTAPGGLAVRGDYAYVTNEGTGSIVRVRLGS